MKAIWSLFIAGALLAAAYSPATRFEQPAPLTAAPPAFAINEASNAVPQSEPVGSGSSGQPDTVTLQAARKQLDAHFEQIEERHPIRLMSMGTGKDHIMVQIRRAGDVEAPMTDEEIEAVKQTLYSIAGGAFPLQLSVIECCKGEANVTGKIKSYDQQQHRVLIVNEHKKNGNTNDPEATWIRLEADGVLVVDGNKAASGLSASLVGREAKAWTAGFMSLSYPGQASALKIVIE